MKQLGERIKLVRGIVSQSDFSTKIGVSQNALSRYERGVNAPDIESVQKICSLYKIEPKWLVFGEGPMHPGDTVPVPQPQPQQPETPLETTTCPRCAKLEAKVEALEEERRELSAENRQLNMENKQLLRENGELKIEVAVQREQLKSLSGRSVAMDCA